jgi:hypothetical protein
MSRAVDEYRKLWPVKQAQYEFVNALRGVLGLDPLYNTEGDRNLLRGRVLERRARKAKRAHPSAA